MELGLTVVQRPTIIMNKFVAVRPKLLAEARSHAHFTTICPS